MKGRRTLLSHDSAPIVTFHTFQVRTAHHKVLVRVCTCYYVYIEDIQVRGAELSLYAQAGWPASLRSEKFAPLQSY